MRQSMTVHGLVRVAAAALILAQIFFALTIWNPLITGSTAPSASPLVDSLVNLGLLGGWIIAVVAWPTLFFAGLVLVRRTARRLPNPKIARLALWLMWSPLVVFACVAVSLLIPIIGGLIALVGLFSVAVFYIGLFVRLASGIRRVERAQRRQAMISAAAPTNSA